MLYFNLLAIISTIGTLERPLLLILSYWKQVPILLLFPLEDRINTDSRRIKPKSCNTLIGEQPNPSEILLPEDVLIRHRGANQLGQYVLSPAISLLSLA